MTYKVIWENSALSEVAAEFVVDESKLAIIDASRKINIALEVDPYGSGSHLSEGLYYIDRPPLRGIYSIDDEQKIVKIVRFRRV